MFMLIWIARKWDNNVVEECNGWQKSKFEFTFKEITCIENSAEKICIYLSHQRYSSCMAARPLDTFFKIYQLLFFKTFYKIYAVILSISVIFVVCLVAKILKHAKFQVSFTHSKLMLFC